MLPRSAKVGEKLDETMLGGVVVLTTDGSMIGASTQELYTTTPKAYQSRPATIKAIPYYANANRGAVDMAVWLPLTT
jgi:DUF1680 family protein